MGFMGYVEDYEEYKKTSKVENVIGDTGNQISDDDIPELSEEDAMIIRQTIVHNDPSIVYMQSDVSFYDNYYNQDIEVTDDADEEFMDEVKAIRRIYKDYKKYLYAVSLREDYLDMLVEKYGGEDMFILRLQSGSIKDWIPPKPIFSTNSPDYKLFLEGKIATINDWDDERIEEIMNELIESSNISPDDIGIKGDVITSPLLLDESNKEKPSTFYSNRSNSFDGVTTNDLEELQGIMKSWITQEEKIEAGTYSQDFFSAVEDKIRKDYFTSPIVNGGGLAKAMNDGTIEEEETDWNEMVIDPKSNRPMTRGELHRREFIRSLDKLGGWDEWKLMKHMRVGSGFELKLMEQQRRTRRNARKKAKAFMSDIGGDEFINEISSIDQLNDILFDD